MIKLSENYRWIISLLIAIIIGGFSIYFSKTHSKKSLAYKEISYFTTNYKDNYLKSGLKIIYNNQEVDNLHTLILEFNNDGDIPISTNDFESPIFIIFGNKTKILRAEIIKTTPEKIPIFLDFNDTIINIKPTLLNSNDKFLVQIIITGNAVFPKINGRICGVESIRDTYLPPVERNKKPYFIWSDFVCGFLLLIFGTILYSLVFIADKFNLIFNRIELVSWGGVVFISGINLVASWGESINFMLQPWINVVLFLILFPLFVWLFYKLKSNKIIKNKSSVR